MANWSLSESSLAPYAERFASASRDGAVTIREVTVTQQFDLRGDGSDAKFRNAVSSAISCELPAESCTVSLCDDGHKILWLGPDEWLIVKEAEDDSAGLNALGPRSRGSTPALSTSV